MLIIHIRALPLRAPLQIDTIVIAICNELCTACSLDINHCAVTWQEVQACDWYCDGQFMAQREPDRVMVLAEVWAPDCYPQKTLNLLITSLAKSISTYCQTDSPNIAVTLQRIQSGRLFHHGHVARW